MWRLVEISTWCRRHPSIDQSAPADRWDTKESGPAHSQAAKTRRIHVEGTFLMTYVFGNSRRQASVFSRCEIILGVIPASRAWALEMTQC
jgi:hypothetical protein